MRSRLLLITAFANATVAAVVAVVYGSGGLFSAVAGIVLAPAGVVAAHAVGDRVAGARFAAASAIAYVLLPLVGVIYFYGSYRSTYKNEVLPVLLGVEKPGALALGVAIAVAVCLLPRTALAAGGVVAAVCAIVVWGVRDLSPLDGAFHETGWSPALLEWLPLAGVIGVARRSPWLAAGLGGWLTFFVLRAADVEYYTGAFWRGLAPALPAAAVLVTAIGLLVPRLRPAPKPKAAPRDAP
jgi:hypothetical protein